VINIHIFVIGGGKEVYFLTKSLLSKGHKITVINQDEEFCVEMSRNFKITVVLGDGSKPYVLDESGIAEADLVIALTNNDPDNLVICQIAEKIYGIIKTFSIVNDPENVEVFKALNVDTVFSAISIISLLIEQRAVVDDIRNLVPIAEGQLEIMEIDTEEGFPVIGKKISELVFPSEAIVICTIRNGKALIVRGNTDIQTGDRLIVLCDMNAQSDVIRLIRGRID
jgi:trk system potassium uptake protein TrkA